MPTIFEEIRTFSEKITMEFNPNNPIVQLCLQGMQSEEAGNFETAVQLFRQAGTKR
ncbi:hypothetical protein [Mucilaginibacter humi]|uniref:hypothetical protein n=1 Tax=Mucilaginibacter humi TaxID=2732510 RepID=UPI001FE6D94D|nr:hypothetical protein [Mucilaginibacter humi]